MVDAAAEGLVLEAGVQKGLGVTASVLVRSGTLRPSDHVVAGTAWGKLKAMHDESGARVDAAGPSAPVRVPGFRIHL